MENEEQMDERFKCCVCISRAEANRRTKKDFPLKSGLNARLGSKSSSSSSSSRFALGLGLHFPPGPEGRRMENQVKVFRVRSEVFYIIVIHLMEHNTYLIHSALSLSLFYLLSLFLSPNSNTLRKARAAYLLENFPAPFGPVFRLRPAHRLHCYIYFPSHPGHKPTHITSGTVYPFNSCRVFDVEV